MKAFLSLNLSIFVFLNLLLSCQTANRIQKPLSSQKNETKFQDFVQQYFSELWTIQPEFAMYLGHSDYPAFLTVRNTIQKQNEIDFYLKYKKILNQYQTSELSIGDLTDLQILKKEVDQSIWYSEIYKAYEWNPSLTNIGYTIGAIWENIKYSNEQKEKLLLTILPKSKAYHQAGYESLKIPTLEYLNLAIKQNSGTLSYINQIKNVTQNKLLITNLNSASEDVQNYINLLNQIKNSQKKFKSFRISKKDYQDKFKHDLQTKNSADQIFQEAKLSFKETRKKMAVLAKQLWPKYFPNQSLPNSEQKIIRLVLDQISNQHVTAAEFLPAIQKQIPELWNFVIEKNLLTLDKEKVLRVRETPIYQQGFAGASINSPGAFESEGETYYNVTPPTSLAPDRQVSYLREYNNYMLQILNIHEAVPGHFVQLVYSNKTPSLVKKIYGNGTMNEGWAVYTERMMLEQGYGNNQPELWLMYYKWFLRVAGNTILDYSIHNLNMTKKQGLNLLIEQAFQENTEAEEKWNRATLSQAQLSSYFAGFSEIYNFRNKLIKEQGDRFDLKKFHEKFLSYGSISIETIIQLMNDGHYTKQK